MTGQTLKDGDKGRPEWLRTGGLALAFTLVAALFSSQSLQKGQVIKQFFAYSVTESLASGDWLSSITRIFETVLPCPGAPVWVEEPPVFHLAASFFLRWFPETPALAPLLAFFLLAAGLIRLGRRIGLSGGAAAVAALTPIFFRYSIQHFPDLLAVAALVWAAERLMAAQSGRARSWQGIALLVLATTTKVLTLFPATAILAWHYLRESSPRRLAWCGGTLALAGAPFAVWLAILFAQGIANPFQFNSGLDNRHSGGWDLLLQGGFYARFFTWNVIKGAGWILAGAAAWELWNKRGGLLKLETLRSPHGLLILWALTVLPYWLLIRQANWVHDYYTLPFVPSMALLGASGLMRISRPALRWTLVAIAGSLALISLAGQTPVPVETPETGGLGRPNFCGMEKG